MPKDKNFLGTSLEWGNNDAKKLLKFGGDYLQLWLKGEENETRKTLSDLVKSIPTISNEYFQNLLGYGNLVKMGQEIVRLGGIIRCCSVNESVSFVLTHENQDLNEKIFIDNSNKVEKFTVDYEQFVQSELSALKIEQSTLIKELTDYITFLSEGCLHLSGSIIEKTGVKIIEITIKLADIMTEIIKKEKLLFDVQKKKKDKNNKK